MKADLKVLLVDDDKATNLYNQYNLKKLGCCKSIDVALNGQEAIEFLTSKNEEGNHPQPHLIFLDINMPLVDGWEFLELYDQLSEEQKGDVIVVMLTTSVNQDDFKKAEANPHIKDFKSKPLTIDKMQELIESYWESK